MFDTKMFDKNIFQLKLCQENEVKNYSKQLVFNDIIKEM